MPSSPGSCGIGPIYSISRDLNRASTSRKRSAVTTKAQCCMEPMAVARRLFPLRNLEEGEKAVIPHIEEVMAHPLIGWIAAIAGAGAKARRHLHGMDERHTEHVDIEVDRCLHVVGAEREVMNTAQSRCHERTAQVFMHVVPPVSRVQRRLPSRER